MTTTTLGYQYTDLLPDTYYEHALRADLRRGLSSPDNKQISPTWFYDARGSDLFEQITQLDSYYPTRCEHQILTRRAATIADLTRAQTLIELGSGSSLKTQLLLDALGPTLESYIPLDVSSTALRQACDRLAPLYPELQVHGIRTDFHTTLELPARTGPRLFAFLGSTIGNLQHPQARVQFLDRLRTTMLPGDHLLLGADLVKDPATLVAAYDDPTTAQFNLNVLAVINRETGADFNPGIFTHTAPWNPATEQIEMRLRSNVDQVVNLPALDMTVPFTAGEDLLTEISAKFTRSRVTTELAAARMTLRAWYTDPDQMFGLALAAPVTR